LNVEYFTFDTEEMNIDIDATEKKIKKLAAEGKKPTLAMFGGSVLPFPHPIKDLAPILREHGAKSCYDAAHVAGLVAGHQFQDPMHEGVDAMTCSTHKTLPGPQGGLILSHPENAEKITKATFPGNVSNRNLRPYNIDEGRHFEHPGEIRCDASEATRLGMKASEMKEIAQLMHQVVVRGEDPAKIGKTVNEFRKEFTRVHYAFESTRDAY